MNDPTCGKPHLARGWCTLHYQRWRKHGDARASVRKHPGNGTAQRFFRNVVLAYTGDDCLIWPFASSSNGYAVVRHNSRQQLVPRLVCEYVNGPAPTHQHEAAHSCGRGCEGCVTPKHLRWAKHAENEADKLIHGTRLRGEELTHTKLTESDVIAIRRLKGRMSHRTIAAMFGISRATIGAIHRHERWAWLG